MKRKRASEIFAEVDPHLRVVDGGVHRRCRKSGLNGHDWERGGGTFCQECRQEVVWLKKGLCPQCHQKVEAERMEKFERKAQKRYYIEQLRTGRMTLTQMKKLR